MMFLTHYDDENNVDDLIRTTQPQIYNKKAASNALFLHTQAWSRLLLLPLFLFAFMAVRLFKYLANERKIDDEHWNHQEIV